MTEEDNVNNAKRKELAAQLVLELLGIEGPKDPRYADAKADIAEGTLSLRIWCDKDSKGAPIILGTKLQVTRETAFGTWPVIAEKAWADTGLSWGLLAAYADDAGIAQMEL